MVDMVSSRDMAVYKLLYAVEKPFFPFSLGLTNIKSI